MRFPEGGRLQGDFVKDKLQPGPTEIYFVNGDVIKGKVDNEGDFVGEGTRNYKSGDIYTGMFWNN